MTTKQVEILFVCGSPRAHTSEALLTLLEQGVREAGARSRRFLLSKKYIAPCRGCGYCEKAGTCILADQQAESKVNDDYPELLDALAHADALAVISPLFFAGPPAQLKAAFDRMQPFWARRYLLGQKPLLKRPAQIFIVGGGGDSHGYEPLVAIARSALAVAGFTIEKTQNFIGFKHTCDVTPLPSEEEAAQMAFGELAHLRKAAAAQREFRQRALAAGRAFARFVTKSTEKLELQAELQLVEAEMAELTDDRFVFRALSDDFGLDDTVEIMDHIDSGFEALKQAARASRASKATEALAEAKAELVAEVEGESGSKAESDAEAKAESELTNTAEHPWELDAEAVDGVGFAHEDKPAHNAEGAEPEAS